MEGDLKLFCSTACSTASTAPAATCQARGGDLVFVVDRSQSVESDALDCGAGASNMATIRTIMASTREPLPAVLGCVQHASICDWRRARGSAYTHQVDTDPMLETHRHAATNHAAMLSPDSHVTDYAAMLEN